MQELGGMEEAEEGEEARPDRPLPTTALQGGGAARVSASPVPAMPVSG